MDTVGDMVYGHVFNGVVGPDLLPHGPGDPAMETAHTIGMGGESQG